MLDVIEKTLSEHFVSKSVDFTATDVAHIMLDLAQAHADTHSTCNKVKVGSVILIHAKSTDAYKAIYGCNRGTHNCKKNGCRRVMLYGNASKEHRLPSDCDAIHSEVEAIATAAKEGWKLEGSTIFVTRYPCEACARAIAASGIKRVVYGREESISPYTALILSTAGVTVTHMVDWEREDNNE